MLFHLKVEKHGRIRIENKSTKSSLVLWELLFCLRHICILATPRVVEYFCATHTGIHRDELDELRTIPTA